MEDILRQLGLLEDQTSSATDPSFSKEPSFSTIPTSQFISPLHEAAMITAMEPSIPVLESRYTSPAESNDQLKANNNQLATSSWPSSAPFQPTDNQLAFMSTPFLSSPSCSNEVLTSNAHAQFGLGTMGPFPMIGNPINSCIAPSPFIPNQSFSITGNEHHYQLPFPQNNPSTAYLGLENQAPTMHYKALDANFTKNLSHLFPMEDLMEHNLEGIASFLAGHVRPGPDVPRIFKCDACGLEFPNAQAFGGHMSSHSKLKIKMEHPSPPTAGPSKKARVTKKEKLLDSQVSKKANTSKASKKKNKKKKKNDEQPVNEKPIEDKETEKEQSIEAEEEKALEAKLVNAPLEDTGNSHDDSVNNE